MIFLDTNICRYFLKGMHPEIAENLKALSPQKVKIAAIVQAELMYGARRSAQRARLEPLIMRFLAPYEIIAFDAVAAEIYADLRSRLEAEGQGIGPNDLILAATVMAQHGSLVTHNTREFGRVVGLKILDWAA